MINDPNLEGFFNPIMLWHFLSDESFLTLSVVYLLTVQSVQSGKCQALVYDSNVQMTFEQLCVITCSLQKEASLKHVSVHRDSIYCFSLHSENWYGKLFFFFAGNATATYESSLVSSKGHLLWKTVELKRVNAIQHTWKPRLCLCICSFWLTNLLSAAQRGCPQEQNCFIFCLNDLHKVIPVQPDPKRIFKSAW